MGIAEEWIQAIHVAAHLHDIGKMGVEYNNVTPFTANPISPIPFSALRHHQIQRVQSLHSYTHIDLFFNYLLSEMDSHINQLVNSNQILLLKRIRLYIIEKFLFVMR